MRFVKGRRIWSDGFARLAAEGEARPSLLLYLQPGSQ